MDQLDKTAIDAVAQLAREAAGITVEIDGRAYATSALHDPRKPEPVPNAPTFFGLVGFGDFIRDDSDEGYRTRGVFIHVVDAETVVAETDIFGKFNQRATLAVARAIVTNFRFGQFMPADEFVIALQAQFVDSDDRARVIALVGNLEHEAVAQFSDDGQTQRATARVGIVKRAEAPVPNPVILRPYRTFIEVRQPASPFVLRLRGGGDGKPPFCALFEADGGHWRIEAHAAVKAWLTERIADKYPVFG